MKNILLTIVLLSVTLNLFSQNGDECENIIEINTIIRTDLTPEEPVLIPGLPSDPPIVREDEERHVWWIHGFGGDDTALSDANFISTVAVPHPDGGVLSINERIGYPAREIRSYTPGYDTGQDLAFYGFKIGGEINSTSILTIGQTQAEARSNFAITASWGGNVTRMADLIYSSPPNEGFRLGGIVSMGGSHIGAEIAENLLTTASETDAFPTDEFSLIDFSAPGDVRLTNAANNFLVEANESLIAGPLYDPIDDSFILSLLARTEAGGRTLAAASAVSSEFVTSLPSVLGNGLFSRTGLNLHTDSDQQRQLANGPSTTVNVAGYGVENMELGLWRLFYWGKNNPNNIPTALPSYTNDGQGFFEANSDDFAIEIFERNLAAYQMRQITSQAEADNLFKLAVKCFDNSAYYLFNIGKCNDAIVRYPIVRLTAQGYARGIEWFQNSSDFWHELTGALTFEQVESPLGTCQCEGPVTPDPINIITYPCRRNDIGNSECIGPITFIPTVTIMEKRKESDIVVLAESASAFPGAVHQFRMLDSNHFNMRNDKNTKALLLDVFNGNSQLNLQYFKTPIRI